MGVKLPLVGTPLSVDGRETLPDGVAVGEGDGEGVGLGDGDVLGVGLGDGEGLTLGSGELVASGDVPCANCGV